MLGLSTTTFNLLWKVSDISNGQKIRSSKHFELFKLPV